MSYNNYVPSVRAPWDYKYSTASTYHAPTYTNNRPYSMNSSQTSSASSKTLDQIYGDYFMKDDIYHRQTIIDKTVVPGMSQEAFAAILRCLVDETEECVYKTDLFYFFLDALKTKAPSTFKGFVTKMSTIEDFIMKTPYLEYIDYYTDEVLREDKFVGNRIKDMVFHKIESMSLEAKYTRFYLDDVEKFISFKQTNANQEYTNISEERLFYLRKTIKSLFYFTKFFAQQIDPDFLCSALTKWLLIIHPEADIENYGLIANIADLLASVAGPKENRLKTVLIGFINILQIEFQPKDAFTSYNNIALALEMFAPRDLEHCLEKYFVEIMQAIGDKKETLQQIFTNLVTSNFTNNTCLFIRVISESLRVNRLFDQLYHIFTTVVIPYLIPKLRVRRAFKENISLCEFYFYGFAAFPLDFPITLLENFVEIIKHYLAINFKKDIDAKQILERYLDFLDIVCYIYTLQAKAQSPLDEIRQYVHQVRKEAHIIKLHYELERDFEKAQANIWQIAEDDMRNQMNLISIESVNPKFKPSKVFKGIRNIGNTCYLACIMQTLFNTDKFRQKVMDLVEETIQTSPLKSGSSRITSSQKKTDLLRETQLLFQQLDTKKSEPKYADPRNFREALPFQFKRANEEQDTSEFLRIYFDSLESRLKATSKKELVDECFAGYYEMSLQCRICGKTKTKREKFLDLVLNFPEGLEGSIDEIEMLKKAFEPEKLSDILCEYCKKNVPETLKTMSLEKLPMNLVVTLNRFKFDEVGKKLLNPVNINHQLDFKEVVGNSAKLSHSYELYAVLVHIGHSAEHGHYYVLIKDRERKQGWYMLNDSQCLYAEDLELAELFQGNPLETPYILFYKADLKENADMKSSSVDMNKSIDKDGSNVLKRYERPY